ncbi:ABC transporter substrate-binding protein [Kribbella pittospori]|uniref:ABC transporter substrate-binding protein n=1 Tax=Kribbella pittospori TaxID=722689 RepID=A0A4R0KP71_9ACTN|nr:ABC transporter substrate-binding protein [Kribbella pittospori]TCC62020.1 ABC transporter substrate-binding protein [Kribbella pittospori]
MTGLPLRVALGRYGHTADLLDGRVLVDGCTLDPVGFASMITAYRRMVRSVEFDVCELAPTTYLIARALGAPYVALPVFLSRRFHHEGLVVRNGAGIERPTDLHGRRVGVRAYSVTSAVWTRGVLADEYGVDPAQIEWIVDDDEHVESLVLPSNVRRPGPKLVDLFRQGEVDAAFTRGAGIGDPGVTLVSGYHELLDEAASLAADWYRRTGVYPIHGVVVVREELLNDHPWLAGALLQAFQDSRSRYLHRLGGPAASTPEDLRYQRLAEIVGNPLPYGLQANQASIGALVDYSRRQGLVPADTALDRFFPDLVTASN